MNRSAHGERFVSSIVPKYVRRSLKIDEAIPLLYLRGLSTGDMLPALEQLLGKGVSGVSAPNVTRLKSIWKQEYEQWRKRGATVIAVTNYPLSPLAKIVDLVLLTADFSEHWGGEVVSKRVSELCILESLYINYLILKDGNVLTKLHTANEAVAAHKV
jgi:hypothetical protein